MLARNSQDFAESIDMLMKETTQSMSSQEDGTNAFLHLELAIVQCLRGRSLTFLEFLHNLAECGCDVDNEIIKINSIFREVATYAMDITGEKRYTLNEEYYTVL